VIPKEESVILGVRYKTRTFILHPGSAHDCLWNGWQY